MDTVDHIFNKILKGKKPLVSEIPELMDFLLNVNHLKIESGFIKSHNMLIGKINNQDLTFFGLFKQILPEIFGYQLLPLINPECLNNHAFLEKRGILLARGDNAVAKDTKIKQTDTELTVMLQALQIIREQSKGNPEYGFNDSFPLFLKAMCCLTPQSYGTRIQDRIRIELKGHKVSPQSNRGDIMVDNIHYEVKNSLITTTNNALNLVQVRLWQNVSYLCFWFNPTTNQFSLYELTHEQMEKEMKDMGASSAHGTQSANENNTNIELRYSIPIDLKDEDFQRWEKSYKSSKLDHLFEA